MDKMRGEVVKNVCFCLSSGYKNCSRRGGGGRAQCVELKLRWHFCVHTSTYPEIYFQSNFWISFDISTTKFLLGLVQKHICNIIEEMVCSNCTFLLFSKVISSIMFQICFSVNHSQGWMFKISNIIQNID